MDVAEPISSPPEAPSEHTVERPVFYGYGREYLRIWVVNFFLTLVTLGIFLPWARVRTRRYFYGNTALGGERFHYTADPRKILIGYLIVGTAFLLWTLGEFITFWMPLILFPVFLGLYPWVRWKSVRFFANHSTHRHIPLRFTGELSTAYKVFLGLPLVSVLTFGLLWPYAVFRGRAYYFDSFRFGDAFSEFHGRVSYVYRVCLFAGLALFLVGLISSMVSGAVMAVSIASSGGEVPADPELPPIFFVFIGIGYVFFFAVFLYVRVLLTNYFWSHTQVRTPDGSVRFLSEIEPLRYLWIIVTNLVLTVLTLGLYLPFAKVRLYRYRLARLRVTNAHRLGSVTGRGAERISAVGESAGDWLDLDFGL